MKVCADKRCPFIGYRFNPNGRLYEVSQVSLLTTNRTGKDEWYISFFEIGHEKAIHYAIRLSDLDRINSIHIDRISSPHPDAPKIGNYKHFKGNRYRVTDVLFSPVERRWFVCYKALYEEAMAASFIRTMEDFNKDVGDREITPRFVLEAV